MATNIIDGKEHRIVENFKVHLYTDELQNSILDTKYGGIISPFDTEDSDILIVSLYIYIYIYVCVCMCVCVC